MFENKKEPQDIFEGVEPPANLPVAGEAPSAPVPAPRPAAPAAPAAPAPAAAPVFTMAPKPTPVAPSTTPPPSRGIVADSDLSTGGHLWKTLLIVAIAFLSMGLAAFLAYRFMNPSKDAPVDERDGATQGDTDEQADLPDGKGEGSSVDDEPDVQIVIDTDGDGLSNDDEIAAGTSVSKPDTDSDLLGDREEVEVYETDPLNADTDGDSFEDGQEVRSGYNPKGAGKLLEIPSAE